MATRRSLTVKELLVEVQKNYPNAIVRLDQNGPYFDWSGDEFPEDQIAPEELHIHMDI